MTSIIWSAEATADLSSLRVYIAEDKPGAAREVALHILKVVDIYLAENPELGDPGRVPGTRELVISRTQYIVAYHVRNGVIQILRIYGSSQHRPRQR